MIVILMGVSGAGKTTVGRRLAQTLGWDFVEGDDLHPAENRAKMASGVPLNDQDRWPWLDRVRESMLRHEASGRSVVIACSALKEAYRSRLEEDLEGVRFVLLHGEPSLLRERLEARTDHFFDPALLQSQFETLEDPAGALRVEIDLPVDDQIAEILDGLELADE